VFPPETAANRRNRPRKAPEISAEDGDWRSKAKANPGHQRQPHRNRAKAKNRKLSTAGRTAILAPPEKRWAAFHALNGGCEIGTALANVASGCCGRIESERFQTDQGRGGKGPIFAVPVWTLLGLTYRPCFGSQPD